MGSKVNISIFSIFAIIALFGSAVTSYSVSDFNGSLKGFSHNIFSEIFTSKGNENIIISPFAIQSCLTMARMGANGETANELDQALGFTGLTSDSVADNYHSLLTKYEEGNILKIANKIYAGEDYTLQDNFKELLSKQFFSKPEEIDFAQTEMAAKMVNTWVELKTNHTIKDLIAAESLGSDTALVLLSAIYFDGKWEDSFPIEDTKEADFHVNENTTTKVQMMEFEGKFQYIRSKDLPVIGVRLPYKNSDLSMLIFVPNNGASFGELSQLQLTSLKDKAHKTEGHVFLPKFKAEFEIDLKETLKKMGLEKMFKGADFSKMLKSSEQANVSKVVHKAFIEVTESGTKAAAATSFIVKNRIIPTIFEANQPFHYAIINDDFLPLFQGTVVGF